MKMRQFSVILLIALSLIGTASVDAQDRMSSKELRSLNERVANKQVRSDLLSILLPIKRYPTGSSRQLHDAWMHTKASATEYKGLCQRDTLLLFYAPTERDSDFEDRPMRPYKIETSRSYRFVAPPKQEYLEAVENGEQRRSPFASECAKADKIDKDNEWLGWFEAESPELAMTAALAIPVIHAWAKIEGNEFASCSKDATEQCKARALENLTLENPGGISKCESAPGEICFGIGAYSDIYTIKARDTGKPIAVEDIISVDHEIAIIVT
jgi:hypothetical protein